VFSFTYFHEFSTNLYEHEFDHVFIGEYDGSVAINPLEVESVSWVNLSNLEHDLIIFPQRYSIWFQLSAARVIEVIRSTRR